MQELLAWVPGVKEIAREAGRILHEIYHGASAPTGVSTGWWIPLDGTGEFIAGSGDFATLIALVQDNVPVLGVIYAPESNVLYWAVRGHGAFKEANGEVYPISAMHHEHDQPDSLVVAISRRQKLENLTAASTRPSTTS
ncbi:UNVERIFIED_CONTAM: hypothetical protein K2H54_000204 [Gekko kuhli]